MKGVEGGSVFSFFFFYFFFFPLSALLLVGLFCLCWDDWVGDACFCTQGVVKVLRLW